VSDDFDWDSTTDAAIADSDWAGVVYAGANGEATHEAIPKNIAAQGGLDAFEEDIDDTGAWTVLVG
jgi:hypothetical protein